MDFTSVGTLSTTNNGNNAGVDYFLVLEPTKNANPGDSLKIQIWGSDLLETRDDTFTFGTVVGSSFTALKFPAQHYSQYGSKQNIGIPGTYKRFQSSDEYVVMTVTNDILSNEVSTSDVHTTPDNVPQILPSMSLASATMARQVHQDIRPQLKGSAFILHQTMATGLIGC